MADLGNAQRLVHYFGEHIRWVGALGQWFYFDGQRWVPDETGELMRCAKATALAIPKEHQAWDEDGRDKLFRWARTSKSRPRLEAMLSLAASEPDIALLPEQLDANPWLLNVENGTVDLKTGALRPHAPEDLLTRTTWAEYDPEAESDRWDDFLGTITDGSEQLARYLQRAIGCALSGAENEKALFILHGAGDTGKTTFLRVIMEVLGEYAIQAERNLLLQRSHEPHPTGIADLFGRRLAVCTEVNKSQKFDAALVKQLTGGDRLRARRMRQDFFEFEPTHTLFLACNDVPGFDPTDGALWRRLKIIPFDRRIPIDEQDPHLVEKLLEDREAILAWAVQGCIAWQPEGLGEPKRLNQAAESHRQHVDPIYRFVQEDCESVPGHEIGATDLYENYKAAEKTHGRMPRSQKEFGSRLSDLGILRDRGSTGRTTYRGIRPLKNLKDSPLSTEVA